MTIQLTPENEISDLPLMSATMTAGQKSAATVARRKLEVRAERLRDIRTQTEQGTLVIRHMTDEQHVAAADLTRQTRARYLARDGR